MNQQDENLEFADLVAEGDMLSKLILLFVFDSMEVPMSESVVLDICTSSNTWIPYFECKTMLLELVDSSFIYEIASEHTDPLYTITSEGRSCIGHFFSRIPASLRETISAYVKANRMRFKRKQEYEYECTPNLDGSVAVALKIVDPTKQILKIEVNVSDKHAAKAICNIWEEKAASVYNAIFDIIAEI